MKWGIYNVLFALVYPFLLPGFLVRMLRRGGYAARMGDRFALYPAGLFGANRPLYDSHAPKKDARRETKDAYVWIHAVSVGEVQVAGQLMREWRTAEPDVRFCFSTTSSTGWKIAEKELSTLNAQRSTSSDVLIYNPLDFPNFVKSALRTVRPRAIVLTESEIWPNFIRMAKREGIPLFLINARVSDRSAPRYKLAKWWFGDVLSSFTRIFAQSDLDKARLMAAGAPTERVEVTGSFKFDVARRNPDKERELREWIFGCRGDRNVAAPCCGEGTVSTAEAGVASAGAAEVGAAAFLSPQILLGGSTWPGEDEVLLRIYRKIVDRQTIPMSGNRTIEQSNNRTMPVPVLVIAPRHFEKADAIEENIRKFGFCCVRRSRGEGRETRDERRATRGDMQQVFLADTTGELMGLYGIADVVFVGKSLCAHGSQNMIEPCLCGKPTFVGPYTENFRPVMSDLLASDAIVQVKDADELERRIVEVFACGSGDRNVAAPFLSPQMAGLGARAKAAVERRLGVVAKCVREIRSVL